MDINTNNNENNENKKSISYTDFFKNRFKKHDIAVKKIILQIPTSSYRKKRNYQDAFAQGPASAFAQGPAYAFAQGPASAFAQGPAYTRFTDEDELEA